MVTSSAKTRPAWIHDNAPGSGVCSLDAKDVSCIGVSLPLASQEEAEDEASDTSLESFGWEVGRKISDDKWLAAVPVLFIPARDAAIAAYGRDAQSTQAKRDMHDGLGGTLVSTLAGLELQGEEDSSAAQSLRIIAACPIFPTTSEAVLHCSRVPATMRMLVGSWNLITAGIWPS